MTVETSLDKCCPKCFRKYPSTAEKCEADGVTLVSHVEKDLTGQVLDERYTIIERVGRGGMGVVYKAEQHLIKRVVALKVLRREIIQDENAVKRFLAEARAIASLSSPHTVTLYDFGVTTDGLLYYTMELLAGTPLSRLIRSNGPLELGRAVNLILQACDSIEEAHDHGILHRDVKPDNLFVTERRGQEDLKVLDFGIAKFVGEGAESVTATGMMLGSPPYLSPEQAKGNPVVPASDLYSLGVVLYEMLAGLPPFQNDTPMKTIWAHVQEPMPPLSRRNPKVQIPRTMEAFLRRALEKDPERRFKTVVAFREALKQAAYQEPAPEVSGLRSAEWQATGLEVPRPASMPLPSLPKPAPLPPPPPPPEPEPEPEPHHDPMEDGHDEPSFAFYSETGSPSWDGGHGGEGGDLAGLNTRRWLYLAAVLLGLGIVTVMLLQEEVPAVRDFLRGIGAHQAEVGSLSPARDELVQAPVPKAPAEPKPAPQPAPEAPVPLTPDVKSAPADPTPPPAVAEAAPAPKVAEPPAPLSTEEQKRLERSIRAHIAEGKKELRRGRYLMALSKFDDAQKLGGESPELKTLIDQCIKKLEAQSKQK